MATNGMYSTPDEAVELARRAYRLDTTNKWYHQFLGQALIFAQRYPEALGVYTRLRAAAPQTPANYRLLAALYALRKRLAAKQNVPAYMGFSDATLREMVQSKPLSMDEFLNITGVGEKKAARYGMAFLRVIEEMVNSR